MLTKLIQQVYSGICKLLRIKGYGISVIVPTYFQTEENQRAKNWHWLENYWRWNLPGAEVIIGHDPDVDHLPFSKSVAVNNGVKAAKGDVLVVVDADVYIDVNAVKKCAEEIRIARKKGRRLWFIPYRNMFRLTLEASNEVLASNTMKPLRLSTPPSEELYMNKGVIIESTPVSKIGHWYGAMIQIMPREAMEAVGGWDSRFRGWGSEDHAAVFCMDTLYGYHKTLPGQIAHLWHPTTVRKNGSRLWDNQNSTMNNDKLFRHYKAAIGNPHKMRLVASGGLLEPEPDMFQEIYDMFSMY